MKSWVVGLRARVWAGLITAFTWARRPVRLRIWHVAVAVALLITVGITGYRYGGGDGELGGMRASEGVHRPGPVPSITAATGGRPAGSSLAGLADGLAARRLLSIDMRSGHAVLTLARGDGTRRHPVWDIGTSVQPVVLPDSNDLLVSMPMPPSPDRRLR